MIWFLWVIFFKWIIIFNIKLRGFWKLIREKINDMFIFLGEEKIDIFNICVDLVKIWKIVCF